MLLSFSFTCCLMVSCLCFWFLRCICTLSTSQGPLRVFGLVKHLINKLFLVCFIRGSEGTRDLQQVGGGSLMPSCETDGRPPPSPSPENRLHSNTWQRHASVQRPGYADSHGGMGEGGPHFPLPPLKDCYLNKWRTGINAMVPSPRPPPRLISGALL